MYSFICTKHYILFGHSISNKNDIWSFFFFVIKRTLTFGDSFFFCVCQNLIGQTNNTIETEALFHISQTTFLFLSSVSFTLCKQNKQKKKCAGKVFKAKFENWFSTMRQIRWAVTKVKPVEMKMEKIYWNIWDECWLIEWNTDGN